MATAGLLDPADVPDRLRIPVAGWPALAFLGGTLLAHSTPAPVKEHAARDAVERAVACAKAGADGVFVPGVVDPATVSALVEAVPVPLNVLAGPGAPDVATLARLGVSRISLGSSIAQAAYGLALRAAREVLAEGTCTTLAAFGDADYGRLNALLT